ncbi:MAG: fasciclin domain-containing protein [Pseudomonadota bacterium]
MHPQRQTIAEIAAGSGDFEILVKALALTAEKGGSILLGAAGDADADLTVFAPTDAAFFSLAKQFGYEGHDEQEAFDALVSGLTDLTGSADAAIATLNDVLSYHVSAGEKTLRELRKDGDVETLLVVDGEPQSFHVDGRNLIDADDGLPNPRIVTKNIDAANGKIQAIDEVLIPIDLSGLIEDSQKPSNTIADIAVANGDFDILVKALALTATEGDSILLAAASNPDADLTVFAPTDAAFFSLAAQFGYKGHDEQEAFDALVAGLTDLTGSAEAAIATLNDVLSYHVSAGEKTLREIRKEGEVETLLVVDGEAQSFKVDGRELIDADDGLENPRVVIRNIDADNGKIQAIDEVLIPIDLTGLIEDSQKPGDTIADIAAASGDFDILVKALALTSELGDSILLGAAANPDADLTVFAPTDAAFFSLAEQFGYTGGDEQEAFDALVAGLTDLTGSAEAAVAVLDDVLSYHVSAGEKAFREIRDEGSVETLLVVDGEAQSFGVQGRQLIDADDGLENPRITDRNIEAANGKIQVIDEVLIPIDLSGLIADANKPTDTIADIATASGDFDILVKALALTADLGDSILLGAAANPDADLTVFAPTDKAFISLAEEFGFDGQDEDEAFDALVAGLTDLTGSAEAAVAVLNDVLSYHVSVGAQAFRDIRDEGSVETLLVVDGEAQSFGVKGSQLVDADDGLDNPRITTRDIEAANGKIQVIDEVLIPIDLSGLIEEANKPTIAEIASTNGDFDILVKALALTAELGDSILLGAAANRDADLTVFAPTDKAFLSLAEQFGFEGRDEDEAFDALVAGLTDLTGSTEAAVAALNDVLSYHVSAGEKTFREIRDEGEVETLLVVDGEAQSFGVQGRQLIDADDGLENPRIAIKDIDAVNGSIQAIDEVLIPIDLSGLIAEANRPTETIAEIASANGDFDILVKALALTAELGDSILLGAAANPDADLTVFAPTDKAFISLAEEFGFDGRDEDEAFDALVAGLTDLTGSTEAAVAVLNDVLSYHVSAGEKAFGDIRKEGDVETLLVVDGEAQSFGVRGTQLIDADKGLDNPEVVAPNVQAANGTIQVIDEVLIPIDLSGLIEEANKPTIAEIASTSGDFDILVKALALTAELGDSILLGAAANRDADLTVFAPTDAAFLSLAEEFGFDGSDEDEAFDALVAGLTELTGSTEAAVSALNDVLSYHVSAGEKTFREIREEGSVETLLVVDGEAQSFDVKGRNLIDADDGLEDPQVVGRNVEAANGKIQVIDEVLIPIDLSGLIEASQTPPKPMDTIAEIAAGSGDFDILVKALALTAEQGDSILLGAAANPDADLTVFAPTDAAFFSLAEQFGYKGHDEQEAFDALVDGLTALTGSTGAAVATLNDVLSYHVSAGEKTFSEIRKEGDVETLLVVDGQAQSFHVSGRHLIDADKGLENPRVTDKNIEAANGKIQVIDEVLIPIDLSGLIKASDDIGDANGAAIQAFQLEQGDAALGDNIATLAEQGDAAPASAPAPAEDLDAIAASIARIFDAVPDEPANDDASA